MDNAPLAFLLVVLALDIGFSLVRGALAHSRLPRLIDLRSISPQAEAVIRLLEAPRLRVTLRVGSVLLHFLMAGAAWLTVAQMAPTLAFPWLELIVLMGAAVIVLMTEYGLEGLVARNPEIWAMRVVGAMRILDFFLRPLASLMVLLLGESASQRTMGVVTDDELKVWAGEEQPEGTLEQGERQMIYSIFQFGETLCREIMVPRIDVFALDADTSFPEALEAVARSGHSRIPLYSEKIDNVVGILYAKDLLRPHIPGQPEFTLRKFCRLAYFIPEAKKVDELLREMQSRRVHMAIVVDEYGGMAGIVTLEDIVEEIVGEIHDEYDQIDESLYHKISENELAFDGRVDLDDFNDLLETHLTKDSADTLAGYIYGVIGKVPVGGERLEVEDWILIIDQVTGRRIRKVTARRATSPQTPEPAPEPG